jgi:hypothetical protein
MQRQAELLEALAAEVGAAGGRCRALAADLTLAADCVGKALVGFRRGRVTVVVDPVDRAVVRLPRRVIRRLDGWALRQLSGS